jgi:alkanesulfonate monooxygenase SsuD/methylene tetrahydromethanopterin reductase-like flavin-dependent oxidoreductase (luciferase family)
MTKLGTNLPEHLIATEPQALADFLQAIEELGYAYVTVGDHVLGADLSVRPDWKPFFGKPPLYDRHMVWHEPMVLFGYLSALTRSLELCTGILVGPQRQTSLLAKQAAEVDILSGGRTRFVIAAGWNDVEFEGMGVDFSKRGKIMDEQLEVLKLLWTQEVVTPQRRRHQPAARAAADSHLAGRPEQARAAAHGKAGRRLVPLLPVVQRGCGARGPRGDPRRGEVCGP